MELRIWNRKAFVALAYSNDCIIIISHLLQLHYHDLGVFFLVLIVFNLITLGHSRGSRIQGVS